MTELTVAYLHYISLMALFATLFTEHLLIKPNISVQHAKSLVITDSIYGLSAITVLVTGLLRLMYFGKGVPFYMKNPYFHTKLTLFIIIGILSIWPTREILRWRKGLKENKAPELDENKVKKLQMFIRVEILLVLIIPFLAVMMARGYGVSF